MKYISAALKRSFPLVLATLGTPLAAHAGNGRLLMPAGSVIQCTINEPKISSKTDKVGDPVLCTVSHSEMYGRATIPFGSYLVGQFVDYKDPGHFVGKGWMELRFDRMVLQPDTIIPMDARVISVPNYPVDLDGRIHGKGHAVRDTVEWFIPVLWPIDLINLPRRGPRPELKPETRLTLKVMEDVGVPETQLAENPSLRQPMLQERTQPAPIERYEPQQSYAPQQPAYNPAPVQQAYVPQQPAPQTIIYNNYPPPQYVQPPQQQQQVVVVQQPAPQMRPPVVYGYPAPPPYPPSYYVRPPY